MGNGRWEHADLAGNVNEWVLDWYAGFANPTYIDPCNDCAKISEDPDYPSRDVRGGGATLAALYLRSADWHAGLAPEGVSASLGFRCAYP
jgi:formylglycine-generating enzyme required for sulfatase activity